jgi:fatty acyl-CoA reductase
MAGEEGAPGLRLAGKSVLLTGVTGFLGQAVLERILVDLPETRPVLLVRPRGTTPARARVERLLTGSAFGALREREGPEGMRRILEERVEVLEGDVAGTLPPLPQDLDVVIHAAASVSFDPPIDEAFSSNVLGPAALYEAARALPSRPHLIHVSTAYVAGVARGIVHERALEHSVDWREEADAARRARRAVDDASRKPEMLDGFLAAAGRRHSRAGPQTVADDAERRRREWVAKRLIHYGRARAQSLGWPDVYAFTKALGERVAEESAAEVPLSIVRPSIIESALRHPFPGWIEGFKMAEPIILAYGRGTIPEFPGIPEGIIDLIPVDLVVGAVLTVAANPPDHEVAYYHVSSGSRNPLRYRELYELVQGYFHREPLLRWGTGEVRVPEWRFPGRAQVERLLRTGERLVDRSDKALGLLPRSKRVRNLATRLDRQRRRLEFVRRYADLYGAYAEAEVIYTDDRALALHRSLPPDDRRRFGFDAADIDWRSYIRDVHCPSVTRALRIPVPPPPEPRVSVLPRQAVVLAVFDLEGTILASNVVESYLWLRLADLPASWWPAAVASLARSLPRYLAAERRDRGRFLRAFYRRYEGAAIDGIEKLVDDELTDLILHRVAPAGVRRIREHREAGHRVVLVSGALEPLVEPLRPLFDDVVAARLVVRDGRYTGFLERPPLVGEARGPWLRRYAAEAGADLRGSYVYADSHSDLPLLRTVGHPVAVNPDVALYREARRRRWPVEEWRHSSGTPRVLVPRAAQ